MSLSTVYVSTHDIISKPLDVDRRSASRIVSSTPVGVLSYDKTQPIITFSGDSYTVKTNGPNPDFGFPVPITSNYASYGLDSEGNDPSVFIGYEDDFNTDTLANYTYTDTGGPSISYDASNQWVFLNGEDNENQYLSYTFGGSLTTGVFRTSIRKTKDYPADNNNGITLYNSTTGDTDNYYYVLFNGGAYQSTMEKKYNGVTENQNISYDFNDQSKFYIFEIRFTPDSFSFYIDDVLQSTFDTTNNDSINIDSVKIFFSQFDGYLNLVHFSESGTISENTIGYTDLTETSTQSITLPTFTNIERTFNKTNLDISSSIKPKSTTLSVNATEKIFAENLTLTLQNTSSTGNPDKLETVNKNNDLRLDRSPKQVSEISEESGNNVVITQSQIWI